MISIKKRRANGSPFLIDLYKRLESVDAVQVAEGHFQTLNHGLLTFAQDGAGIVVLLVGLVVAFGIADLRLQVSLVLDRKSVV